MCARSRRRVKFQLDERSLMTPKELEAWRLERIEIGPATSSAEGTPARRTVGPESGVPPRSRALAMSSCGLLMRCALALFSGRIRPSPGQMLLGPGIDFDPSWSRAVTWSCPSDSGPVALALTTDGTDCSCSPRFPTPTASLFGCRDTEKLLARRGRCKARHGNGNGFGLTLGQFCAVEGIDCTPDLAEMLMGFPSGWTDVA